MTSVSFWGASKVIVQEWGSWRAFTWPAGREVAHGSGMAYPDAEGDRLAVADHGALNVGGVRIPPPCADPVTDLAWDDHAHVLAITGAFRAPYRPGPSLLASPDGDGCSAQRFGSYPEEPMTLWRVPVDGGPPDRLATTRGLQKIGKPATLAGGKIALSVWDSPLYGAEPRFRLCQLEEQGRLVDMFPRLSGAVHWSTPSPDRARFAFWHSPLDPPFPPWYRLGLATAGNVDYPFPDDLQVMPEAVWSQDGGLASVRAFQGLRVGVAGSRSQADGWRWLAPADGHVASFAVAEGGETALTVWESTNCVPALWKVDAEGEREPFLQSRPAAARANRPQLVRWLSGGCRLEGLFAPPATDGGTRPPLVVAIPSGALDLPWAAREVERWSQEGFAVFTPSYRSSGTAGQEAMLRALRGTDDPPGCSDAADVLAGLDELVGSERVDRDRVFLFGFGHGAYVVNRILTLDQRFRAAVAWEGYADSYLSYCLAGGGGGNYTMRRLYGGSPWEAMERYRALSPIEDVRRVKTPLLLLNGDFATAEPIVWFTALREHGVETELYFYRGEGHGTYRPENLHDVFVRSAGWFHAHGGGG